MLNRMIHPSGLVQLHMRMEGLPVESFAADQAVERTFVGLGLLVMVYEEIFIDVFLVAIGAFAKLCFSSRVANKLELF